jgi:hypothetical protein
MPLTEKEKVRIIQEHDGWCLHTDDSELGEIIAGPWPTEDDAIIAAIDLDFEIVVQKPATATVSILGSGRKLSDLASDTLFRIGTSWFYLRGMSGKQAKVQAVNNGEIKMMPARTCVDAVSVLSLK